jgi:hypothetical protein
MDHKVVDKPVSDVDDHPRCELWIRDLNRGVQLEEVCDLLGDPEKE